MSAASGPKSTIAGTESTPPRTEASAMYWNVLDSTAHKKAREPVPSSSAPGTAPSKTAGRPLRNASHSQSAPVSNGTNAEKDHHCDVMESITALSSRLLFSGCPLLIDRPFPGISMHDQFILDPDALRGTIMDLLAIHRRSDWRRLLR